MAQTPRDFVAELKKTLAEHPDPLHELQGESVEDRQAKIATKFNETIVSTGDSVLSINWAFNNAFKNVQLNPGNELETQWRLIALVRDRSSFSSVIRNNL